jgi:hypothetical protein
MRNFKDFGPLALIVSVSVKNWSSIKNNEVLLARHYGNLCATYGKTKIDAILLDLFPNWVKRIEALAA